MDKALATIVSIVGAIIGLAIVAVVVSRQSATASVITAAGDTLSSVISAAVSPRATAATNGNPSLATFTSPILGGHSVAGGSGLGSGLGASNAFAGAGALGGSVNSDPITGWPF